MTLNTFGAICNVAIGCAIVIESNRVAFECLGLFQAMYGAGGIAIAAYSAAQNEGSPK